MPTVTPTHISLSTPLSTLFRLRIDVATGLKKLSLTTVGDLLYHFPARYADTSEYVSISHLTDGQQATICGVLTKIETKKTFKTGKPMSEATIEDQSGSAKVLWFHQAYLAKMLTVGSVLTLSGKVSVAENGTIRLINPTSKTEKDMSIDSHDTLFARDDKQTLLPVYPETKGVSSTWIHHALERVIGHIEPADPLPEHIREQYSLPTLKTALHWIHFPASKADAEIARKRFAFDEIFSIQLARLSERAALAHTPAYSIAVDDAQTKDFISRLSFHLTGAQERSIKEILSDITRTHPMSRLLEGDVGSGKTAVAAVAAHATILNRPGVGEKKQTFGSLQVAYMAPTEILATQHFESFIELFRHTGISIGLITGSGCRKFPSKVASNSKGWTEISRPQLSKWVANGEIPIVIGTHALIQKNVIFKHLALTIIDEQHRFGLLQRQKLAKKDSHMPHLLSMTATPIPRTLSLTIFGDLDLSLLDEMPIGRKKVITEVVASAKRNAMYEKLHTELALGRQAYVICARINRADDDDTTIKKTMRSVVEEAKALEKIFPNYSIDILHSKLTKEKKESVMHAFSKGEIDILVSTSVVEVGVNVPNATLMIIEGAERFGLAQLHQLRGRVIRGTHQSYCFILTESDNETTKKRLSMFLKANNGFELAEYDLEIRGTGELTGAKQWGVSDIGMDALRNLKLVQAARTSAQEILQEDMTLSKYPLLQAIVEKNKNLHFE